MKVVAEGRDCLLYSTRMQAEAVSLRKTIKLSSRTPFTLEGAMMPCSEARVITEVTPPFRISYVNDVWEDMCGWKADEVLGRPGFDFMQGPMTDQRKLQEIRHCVSLQGRANLKLINYHKSGTPFLNELQITPLLGNNGQVTHLLGTLHGSPLKSMPTLDGAQCAGGNPDCAH